MKITALIILLLNTLCVYANNPLKPLIRKDTISYIQCYVIDPRDGSTFAPYTFLKIGNNYYEGIAFPFRNDDCIENFTNIEDSFKVDYESTIDTAGERKLYALVKKMGIGNHYDSLKNQNFPELLECLKNTSGLISDIFQFNEIRFTAYYYLIRCKKNRNCYGPDTICDRLVDIYRTPIFTKIEQIL